MAYEHKGKHLIAGDWIGSDDSFDSQPVTGPALSFAAGGAEEVVLCDEGEDRMLRAATLREYFTRLAHSWFGEVRFVALLRSTPRPSRCLTRPRAFWPAI